MASVFQSRGLQRGGRGWVLIMKLVNKKVRYGTGTVLLYCRIGHRTGQRTEDRIGQRIG